MNLFKKLKCLFGKHEYEMVPWFRAQGKIFCSEVCVVCKEGDMSNFGFVHDPSLIDDFNKIKNKEYTQIADLNGCRGCYEQV